ncbi:MAG: 2'-5' RNA ligase family protein [Mycobacterium sp.]|nr:2'-5' RNA ligase family protein [Mycobacterium sp.]
MAHSIELLLDVDSDAAIRAMWQALDDAGLPSQVRVKSPTNRPHVTLLAAQRIAPEVDDVLRGLAGRFPVECVVGAPLVFGGTRHTLARLIVPSAELIALHEEVFRLSLPYLTGDPFPHCRPGHWTAHATLGRRLSAEEVGVAMAVLTEEHDGAGNDLPGHAAGLRRWDSDERVDHLLVG